jgi:hypothetical protein
LLGDHHGGTTWGAIDDGVREPQVDRQGHQVLLGAVVEIALEASAFGVLGLDKTLSGGPDLLGPDQQVRVPIVELSAEPDPVQDQTRLVGEPDEQPLLYEGEGETGPLAEPEHPQQLVAVAHRKGSHALVAHECVVGWRRRRRRVGVYVGRPGGGQGEAIGNGEPHLRPGRPGSLGQQHRHPGRQLAGRVRAGDRIRELAEYVVRRRPAQPPPQRGPFEGGLHAREQQRHDGGRQHRQRHTG